MAFLPFPATNLEGSIAVLKQDIGITHEIVHGGINDSVATESGTVPSFAKVINDLTLEVQSATNVDTQLRSQLAVINSNIVISGIQAKDIVARLGPKAKYVTSYGALGLADDTNALRTALAATKYVVIPEGFVLRITDTVVVPPHAVIIFESGFGNTSNQLPSSYIVKANNINGPAIVLRECASFIGGGIVGENGNTGDGIEVRGNSTYIDRVVITNCGRDGIRVGTDDVYQNCNSAYINRATCFKNGRDGISCHDGWSDTVVGGQDGGRRAEANAGIMIHPFCYQNGRHGIYMGRAWWWSVFNALTEGNASWGMYVDEYISAPDTVPRCRNLQIFGGDFNEGNADGSLWYKGYGCSLYLSTVNQQIEYGGIFNNVFGGAGESVNWGQIINRFLTVDHVYPDAGMSYPVKVTKPLTGTAGDGVGVTFNCDNLNVASPPYLPAATVGAEYKSPSTFTYSVRVRKGNDLIKAMVVDPDFKRWYAGEDNAWTLGDPTRRFNGVYAILPEYANDELAKSEGGMTKGGFYHTGDGIVRVIRS